MMANPDVDDYIARSDQWPAEMSSLRPILLACGLVEEIKWNKPCYVHDGNNVVILQEMKDFLALMFFKGALLSDPEGKLEAQGPNSRAARRLCFTSTDEVAALADVVRTYVAEAVEIEEAGLELGPAPDLVLVDELRDRLEHDPAVRSAFEALTPGRQREYNMHVAGAKQAETRVKRVERAVPTILSGKGLRER